MLATVLKVKLNRVTLRTWVARRLCVTWGAMGDSTLVSAADQMRAFHSTWRISRKLRSPPSSENRKIHTTYISYVHVVYFSGAQQLPTNHRKTLMLCDLNARFLSFRFPLLVLVGPQAEPSAAAHDSDGSTAVKTKQKWKKRRKRRR